MNKALEILNSKILNKERLLVKLTDWKKENKKIVFTNGCFDLIHLGHIEVIARSADLGDILIIGVNTDNSIKRLKGPNRPVSISMWALARLLQIFDQRFWEGKNHKYIA